MINSLSTPQSITGLLQDTPLARFESTYSEMLAEQGYAIGTQRQYLGSLLHFGRWMAANGLLEEDLNGVLIVRFVDEHLPICACPGRNYRKTNTVRAALRKLYSIEEVAVIFKVEVQIDAVARELDKFDAFLRDLRGLADNTRLQRRRIIGLLLDQARDPRGGIYPLNTTMLRDFIATTLERWSPASAAVMTGALRAYLRYRAYCGDDVSTLMPVIVSPACWRLASLPETLSSEEVERVLGSFGPPLPSWRRGVAIAQCVARLGLRASEVVGLELEDLNWNDGTIRIRRSKSHRIDLLPMLPPVGAAIVDYLHNERPACVSRQVFVRHVAPVEKPIQKRVVASVLNAAYQRCDLPYTRVHIFRHSLATRVLDAGGTLKEVADVLRHRSLDTTQIYAKLDERRLSAVAMPWPGSLS